MKMNGGYTPKITGRPSNSLHKIPIASNLNIDLYRNDLLYSPTIKNGDNVKLGDIIAEVVIDNQSLYIPSPANGIAHFISESEKITFIKITDIDPIVQPNAILIKEPAH